MKKQNCCLSRIFHMHKTNNKFPPAYNRYIGIEKKTQKIRQITTFNIGDENSECLNLVSHCLVYVTTTQHIFFDFMIFLAFQKWMNSVHWTHQLRCKCITWKFTCLHAHSANSVTICVQKTEWKLNQIWVFSQWWQFFTFTLKNLPITARYFSVFFLWKLRSGLHEIVYAKVQWQ